MADDSEEVEHRRALADGCLARRDYGGALDQYFSALDLRPTDPFLWLKLGEALRGLERLNLALVATMRAILLDRKQAIFHCQAGLLFGQIGLLSDAISELRTAVELEPNRRVFHEFLSGQLERVGDIDGSIEHAKVVCALDPENAGAAARLAELNRALQSQTQR